MPAIVRGGGARPHPGAKKAQTASRRSAPAPRGAVGGKLRAADGALPPHIALYAAGGVFALAVVIALATGGRGERIADSIHTGYARQMAKAGFAVGQVHVQGASAMAQPDIAAAAARFQGQPILDLDLPAMKTAIEQVGWVKEASIVRLLPDTLIVGVVERDRMAVWQHNGTAYVVDRDGRVSPEADPGRFPDLPLIVGQGAPQAAADILTALHRRPALYGRTEALVRIDGRRWDLRLRDGAIVQLPAREEEAALLRLDQLQARQDILNLGLERIDLRDPAQSAVRLRDGAAPLSPEGV